VTGEDYEPLFKVTADNVSEFARQIAADFERQGKAKALATPVRPVAVGDRYGAMYQRVGKSGGLYLQRLMIDTVVGGRKYTVELRAVEGTLDDHRKQPLAVVAGMEFLEAGDGSATQPDAESPDAESPETDSAEDDQPEAEAPADETTD
jgi:hypothetical protein